MLPSGHRVIKQHFTNAHTVMAISAVEAQSCDGRMCGLSGCLAGFLPADKVACS